MQRIIRGALVAAAAAAFACGGGSGSYGSSSPAAPSPAASGNGSTTTTTIAIVGSSGNQAFNPNPASVAAGAAVVWQNNDNVTHHIVMDDGSADIGSLAPGTASLPMTLPTTKAANYHCTIHPSMVGSINGQSAPTPPNCPGGYC